MSLVLNLLKNLPKASNDDENLASDTHYVRKSSALVSDALQKGSDILQLPNGDIIVTEVKTVTYKYRWNRIKNRFERASTGSRGRKRRDDDLATFSMNS